MQMTHPNVSLLNPFVVAMFHHSAFLVALLWIIVISLVILLSATLTGRSHTYNLLPSGLGEPATRTYLRIIFGSLWLADGVLQFQPSMPLGLANNVIAPMAQGSPSWLLHIVNQAVTLWNLHPITLATGAAWIQVGIGTALLTSNGRTGQWIGGISALWSALIWLVGNAAGGIFESNGSILFGWPGATVFYALAGVLIALSPTTLVRSGWRIATRILAVIFGLGAIRQLLPSVGFWHGGNSNALAVMSRTMTQTAQPHWLAWLAIHGGDIAGLMGGGFNILVILWLALSGMGLWMAPDQGWSWPTYVAAWGCLVFWCVAEDAPLFGGLATDFNSLLPLALLIWALRPVHVTRRPVPRRLPAPMRSSTGAVATSFGVAMVLFSAASMLWATIAPAESTSFIAANGNAVYLNTPAAPFTLTDQKGATYTLGEHAGHFTVLTFLDPVCWTDCSLLAAQLKGVATRFGSGAPIDFVAVAANPKYETLANVRSFVRKHQLANISNFYFVTKDLVANRRVWNDYGINVQNSPSSIMSIHSDFVFIISPAGRIVWTVPDDPGTGASYQQTSTEQEIVNLLHQSGLR